jgi:hypothetical protein
MRLLILFLIASVASAAHLKDYDRGLIERSRTTSFSGDGRRSVRMDCTSPIVIQSNYGSVLVTGRGWEFSKDIIFESDLPLTTHQELADDAVLTIVGEYQGNEYHVEFIKHYQAEELHLRLIAVKPHESDGITFCPICRPHLF